MKNKTNDVANTLTFPTTCPNSNREDEKEQQKLTLTNNNDYKRKYKFNLTGFPDRDGSNTFRNKISNASPSFRLSIKSKNLSTSRKKKNLNELECDFERKNFDKNLMTKNYLKSYDINYYRVHYR